MGDCLFASVIARQIKKVDYPNCHLTWAVNSKCGQALLFNPDIDDFWEINTERVLTNIEEWNSFAAEAEYRKRRGEFDSVFLTQIIGDNLFNYDGGIRSSIYNNYPHKITVPHQPIVQLSEKEVENVKQFAAAYRLAEFRRVILVECGPDSFDSVLNYQSAYKLALDITLENKDVAFILSSNKQIASAHPNIIDGSTLSFRENAELTKYCDLFIGCASGISWLTTTAWSKKIDTVLIVNQQHNVFPSMIYDHEYLSLPTDHIIEIKSDEDSINRLKKCIGKILTGEFAGAREIFNEKIKLTNYDYLYYQLESALGKLDFGVFFSYLKRTIRRNGIQILFTPEFIKISRTLCTKSINRLLVSLRLKKKTVIAGQHK